MADVKLKIRQGIIHINSAHLLKSTPTAFVLSLDTRAKYPAVSAWSREGGGRVWLDANERTLEQEATEDSTEIRLNLYGPWKICAVVEGRYTVNIYGVCGEDVPDDKRQIWCDGDGAGKG
jgi:hypothetical protein